MDAKGRSDTALAVMMGRRKQLVVERMQRVVPLFTLFRGRFVREVERLGAWHAGLLLDGKGQGIFTTIAF